MPYFLVTLTSSDLANNIFPHLTEIVPILLFERKSSLKGCIEQYVVFVIVKRHY